MASGLSIASPMAADTVLITDPAEDPNGLKLLTLLYDRVLVPFEPDRFGALWALSSESQHLFEQPPPDVLKGLRSAWTSVSSLERPFRPLTEQYYLDPPPAQKAIIREALRKRHPHLDPASETEWTTIEDVALMHLTWLGYWQRELPQATLVGSSEIAQALDVLQPVEAIGPSIGDLHIDIPDVSELPWREVLELRNSEFGQAFRDKHRELRACGSIDELADRYHAAMSHLVDQLRPSFTRKAILAIISNLPMLFPVSAIGVAMNIAELLHTRKVLRDFGWVFFMSELTVRTRQHGSPSQQRESGHRTD
jgi:hypothetical protein